MIISPTRIEGVAVIELEPIEDERGFFSRAFCQQEMQDAGLGFSVAQANVSFNRTAGTVRGMHYQIEPATEGKLVRCTRGAILDQVVDLRPRSSTYLEHVAVELSSENRLALHVPALCAHGFQTLTDDTEVFYLVSAAYAPDYERGVRHDDPLLGLNWPLPVSTVSDKDSRWPLLQPI